MSTRINTAVLLVLYLCCLCTAAADTERLDSRRQQELVYLLHQDCGSCHGMTLKGGLGPSLLPEVIARKPTAYLKEIITHGVPQKAMPAWKDILEPIEIEFLVDYLLHPLRYAEVGT